MTYKEQTSLSQRKNESTVIRQRYPDRVPVIIEVAKKADLKPLPRPKFLIPHDFTMSQVLHIIRRSFEVKPEQAIFIFVNKKIPAMTMMLKELYQQEKDDDGFLYMEVSRETTFGSDVDRL